MKLYKVITQRDEFFQSKFNPEALEQRVNSLAADGWRVVSMTATDVGSFWGSFWNKGGGAARQELVVLMERDVESYEAYRVEGEAKAEKLKAEAMAKLSDVERARAEREGGRLQPGQSCPKCGYKNDYGFSLNKCGNARCGLEFRAE